MQFHKGICILHSVYSNLDRDSVDRTWIVSTIWTFKLTLTFQSSFLSIYSFCSNPLLLGLYFQIIFSSYTNPYFLLFRNVESNEEKSIHPLSLLFSQLHNIQSLLHSKFKDDCCDLSFLPIFIIWLFWECYLNKCKFSSHVPCVQYNFVY